MPCKNAIITEVTSLTVGQTVEEALDIIEDNKIRTAPVLDEDGKLLGMFGFHSLLTHLLPISVTMEQGLEKLDFAIGSAASVAHKLNELKQQTVETVMDRQPVMLHSDMAIWEGIRSLVKYGSPLPVIDEKTGYFQGLMTEQSAIEELEKTEEELERQERIRMEERKKK